MTTTDEGVLANSRLTAMIGMVLLIALFIEGITIWDVNAMFALHAFVGLFLIPVALLKLGSTGYRFVRYYRRDPAYRRKGPPHPILRVLGPIVVLSTVMLLGTGVALLIVGPTDPNADTWVTVHQGSFIVWVVAMTVHVLGHIIETWRLTTADLRPGTTTRVPGHAFRRSVVALSLVVGVGLGVASLGWNSAWAQRRDHREQASPNN